MNSSNNSTVSRRELGKRAGKLAAVSALAGIAIPAVHAASDSTIQVVLIGCGGRGTGAAANALMVNNAQTKLVAMADVFKDRLNRSYNTLTTAARSRDLASKIEVPPERRFIGFDAYKKAMDCLKPGDVAIFTTPLAFRWVHFTYAIEKGLNVFMEKPLTADGPTSKRMLALADQASAKNLKVGVGLMSRHARNLQELQKRVTDGQIGDILLMRGYRMSGGGANAVPHKFDPQFSDASELEYQIRHFHSFLWASGGCFNDFHIHIIDHLSWMKNAFPIKAMGVGGRHFKTDQDGIPFVDQNFDTYGIEYTFADGTKLMYDGRTIPGTTAVYYSFLHGTKGCAIASKIGDCGGPSSIYKGLAEVPDNMIWRSPQDRRGPYQNEWDELVDAIINDKPYSEVKRGVEASVTASMGRMAAHTGREVTFEQMLNSDHEFAPGIDKASFDAPPPLVSNDKGMYPLPQPGRKKREY
jgi:predicted dehydrogenase